MKKLFFLLALALIIPFSAKADVGVFDGIITMSAPNITATGATFTAVSSLIADDPIVTARGFVWSTLPNPIIGSPQVTNSPCGAGSSAGPIVETFTYAPVLAANTTYHVKAYVTNGDGTFYSDEISFTTIPTLGEWGLIAFGSLIAIIGGAVVWRRVSIS